MMPTIEDGVLAAVVAIVSGLLVHLSSRRAAQATETAAERAARGSIATEFQKVTAAYEQLLNTAKADFAEDLQREAQEREALERRLGQQQAEILHAFKLYLRWAREGAKPPPPWIADWIWDAIGGDPNR